MVTPRIDGIDISHWNVANWALVPGYKLISLKATEGARYVDPTFKSRWATLRRRGTKYRGAYHWIRTDSSVATQVRHLTNVLGSVGGLLKGEFVQLDWETNKGLAVVTSDMAWEFTDRINQFYGAERSVTYSSDWLPDSTLDPDSRREFIEWREAHPDAPLWYANYSLSTSSTGGAAECAKYGADIWQWSSTKIVPGFSGGIDVNQVFDWKTLDLVTNQLIIPVPAPAPIAPVVSASGVRMLYVYIDANGTVWVGNGLARRPLTDMSQFSQYVFLSNTGGGPKLVTANGVQVTRIEDVAHVAAATIDVLGREV